MIAHNTHEISDELFRMYARCVIDVPFSDVFPAFAPDSDESLADLIDCDARCRIALSRPTDLARYLDAISDLPDNPIAFDAAIDFALRSLRQCAMTTADAFEALVRSHPEHEKTIRDAAAIGDLMPSTGAIRSGPPVETRLGLPTQIGPVLADGGKRYELWQILGHGSHGTVYRSVDRALSESSRPAEVAIKIVASQSREFLSHAQLCLEAKKARRITHPYVARVLDQGEHGPCPYFVYEYVEGGDLGAFMKQQDDPMNLRVAARLIAKIARGLQAIHTAGLVHLDLKPANILLTMAGDPKITDFGVALAIDSSRADRLSDEDVLAGTHAYMAPERFHEEDGACDVAADVYSLGIILTELVTGERPRSIGEDAAPSRRPQPKPAVVNALQRSLPRDLAAICARALAEKPSSRFSSAEAIARSLEDWISHRPLAWNRTPRRRRLVLLARRHPATCGLGLVGVLLLMLGSAGVVHVNAKAREQAIEERAMIRESGMREVQTAIKSLHGVLRRGQGQGVEPQWLPTLLVLEELSFSFDRIQGNEPEDFSELRTSTVRRMVDEANAEGRGTDIDVLMLETMLGYWLIRAGDPREAEEILARNTESWASYCSPEDDWLTQVRALRTCAWVARSVPGGEQSTDSEPSFGRFEDVRSQLIASLSMFESDRRGSGFHQLVLESLAKLPDN